MARWPRVGVVVGASLILLGCTSGSDDGNTTAASQAPPSISAELKCEGDDCGANDKEVKVTSCDAPAIDAMPATPVTGIPVKGSLSLRRSTATGAKCDRLYWARFIPDPANDKAFKVVVHVTSPEGLKIERSQDSEPADPTVTAFTVGLKGRLGYTITACVQLSGAPKSEFCAPSTRVV